MHIAKHANTKHTSTMRFGIAIVLLAACGSLVFWDTIEGQISGMSKSSAKQMNKPKNGMFRVNARPRPQPRFIGHRLRTKFRFHNFIAVPFDMEVTSQSETSIP